MRTRTGDAIVDWYFSIADNPSLPIELRRRARRKLTAFALREPGETVEDVDEKANQ